MNDELLAEAVDGLESAATAIIQLGTDAHVEHPELTDAMWDALRALQRLRLLLAAAERAREARQALRHTKETQ